MYFCPFGAYCLRPNCLILVKPFYYYTISFFTSLSSASFICPSSNMYCAVGDACQMLVVSDDDEGLAEAVAQVEEELVEFGLVL